MKRVSILKSLLLLAAINAHGQTDTPSLAYRKPLFDFTATKPTFRLTKEQLNNKSRLLRYYVLSGYKEGVQPVSGIFGTNFLSQRGSVSGTNRVYMLNLSIEGMLTHGHNSKALVLLEVKDPSKYRYDPSYGSGIEWMRKNAYCFEFALPLGALDSFAIIDELLQSLFNVKTYREIQMVKTLVLKRTSSKDKIKALGGGQLVDRKNGNFRNVDILQLANTLADEELFPIIDETGYTNTIDINLGITDWRDIISLRKALNRYDLDLLEEKREVEMLIIKETK